MSTIAKVLPILSLESLQELLIERKRMLEIAARLRAVRVQEDLPTLWEYEEMERAVEAVEAEIAKRKSVL